MAGLGVRPTARLLTLPTAPIRRTPTGVGA